MKRKNSTRPPPRSTKPPPASVRGKSRPPPSRGNRSARITDVGPTVPPPPVTERNLEDFVNLNGKKMRLGPAGVPVLSDDDEIGTETDKTQPFSRLAMRSGERARFTVLTGERAGMVIALDKESLVLGRAREADIVVGDTGVSRRHCRIYLHNGQHILEDLGSTNGTVVNGRKVKIHPLRAADRVQIGPNLVLQFAFFDEAEETLARRLFEASTRDALTGAYNRRFFLDRLESEVAYAVRHDTALGVILFDLDHFKLVNDRYGHPGGDAVLRSTSGLILEMIRTEDVFARWGGEEFGVIVRGIEPPQVRHLAERLRASVKKLVTEHDGEKIGITISAGIANLGEEGPRTAAELLKIADDRLYAAKQGGRDRVCGKEP